MAVQFAQMPTFPVFDVDGDPASLATRWKKWLERFDNFLVAMHMDETTPIQSDPSTLCWRKSLRYICSTARARSWRWRPTSTKSVRGNKTPAHSLHCPTQEHWLCRMHVPLSQAATWPNVRPVPHQASAACTQLWTSWPRQRAKGADYHEWIVSQTAQTCATWSYTHSSWITCFGQSHGGSRLPSRRYGKWRGPHCHETHPQCDLRCCDCFCLNVAGPKRDSSRAEIRRLGKHTTRWLQISNNKYIVQYRFQQ